jgi:hypothetical protein
MRGMRPGPPAGSAVPLSIATIFQSLNSKGVQLRIGTENRKMMLDRLCGNHAIKWITVLVVEARGAHHRLGLKWKKCVSEAILDVQYEIAFEIGRLGKFA